MSVNSTLNRTAVVAVALALLALASPVTAGSIAYPITVNTSSSYFTGVTGSLDFQFNPGDATSQAATATITNFMTDGSLGAIIPPTPPTTGGGASGSLPGTVAIANSALSPESNELNQTFTYGSYFSFTVTFSGDAVDNPNNQGSGSTFSLFRWTATSPHLPPNLPHQPPRRSAGYHPRPGRVHHDIIVLLDELDSDFQSSLGVVGLWGCRRVRRRFWPGRA